MANSLKVNKCINLTENSWVPVFIPECTIPLGKKKTLCHEMLNNVKAIYTNRISFKDVTLICMHQIP